VKIIKGIQIDDVQRNKINVGNNLLNKFWKPQYSLEKGIEKILLYYLYDEKK
jgi:hypothetical protein